MEQNLSNGMEEALLPDGWQEGEDLLAAPDDAAPTTDGAEERSEKTYRLKVNHEEKEVTLSDEEVVARLQKSYAFDALKERQEGTRDYAGEIRQLQRLYPEFKEMPDEVAHLAAEGESLLTAYAVWQGRQAQKAGYSSKTRPPPQRPRCGAAEAALHVRDAPTLSGGLRAWSGDMARRGKSASPYMILNLKG